MKLKSVLITLSLVLFYTGLPAVHAQHNVPPEALDQVGVTEKLGEYITGDITLYNEQGEPVQLDDYLNNGRPLVLAMVYYECPMLCNLILQGLERGVRELAWQPGNQFDILTVSISSEETPALARQAKQTTIERLGRPEVADGWHFMTGEENQVRRLGDQVGFYYAWNEETQEYMHGSTLIFIAEDGKISRYLHGIDYPEFMLRNALSDAANGRIGSPFERAVLFCFQFDPSSGSYVPVAVKIMKLGGLATLLLLGAFLGFFFLREKKATSHNN